MNSQFTLKFSLSASINVYTTEIPFRRTAGSLSSSGFLFVFFDVGGKNLDIKVGNSINCQPCVLYKNATAAEQLMDVVGGTDTHIYTSIYIVYCICQIQPQPQPQLKIKLHDSRQHKVAAKCRCLSQKAKVWPKKK